MARSRALIAFVLVTGLPLLCAALLAGWIVFYPADNEHLAADAAVVLGAAVWGDRPSPVFRERIHHALSLYRARRVRKILFTGAADSSNEPPASRVARDYAVSLGAPSYDILTEEQSRTTEENICRARDIGRAHGLASFLIVSDPLHMRRAIAIARDAGMDAYPAPTPTTRYRSAASMASFLTREVGYVFLYLAARTAGYTPCGDRRE